MKHLLGALLALALLRAFACAGEPPRYWREPAPEPVVSEFERQELCAPNMCCNAGCGGMWQSGIELCLLEPRISDGIAFTLTSGNGTSASTQDISAYDFKIELAPRVWVEFRACDDIGFRATYWQFNPNKVGLSGSPPANGFGSIAPFAFPGVDLSSSVPGDVLSTEIGLDVTAVDFECVRHIGRNAWTMAVSGGVRYASVDETYTASLNDNTATLRGDLLSNYSVHGFGPTLAVTANYWLGCDWSLFTQARGAVLFGEVSSNDQAREDLDTVTPFVTKRNLSRNDLFSTADLQAGIQCSPECGAVWRPLLRIALEGQFWSLPGDGARVSGDLGFLGLNVALGCVW